MHSKMLRGILFLFGFVVMAIVGYVVADGRQQSAEASGWCCIAGATTCTAQPGTQACRANGGKFFTQNAAACNTLCTTATAQ
jgi:hypothetical protein